MPRGVLAGFAGSQVIARELRSKQTPAEEAMWALLRHRKLRGIKFRRQFPIGHFIVDFCSFSLRLVVEIDGEVHESPAQHASDQNRDSYLESRGYEVLRIPNQRVFDQPEAVLEQILQAAHQRGLRDPS